MIIVRENPPGTFVELAPGLSFNDSAGTLHAWQVAELWSDTDLAAIGIYRIAPVVVPAGKTLVSYSFVKTGATVAAVGTFADAAVTAPVTPTLPSYAAMARFGKETGGITVGGVPIATDRESQAMITGAYSMAARDSTWSTQWKTAGGQFVTIDAATMIAVALAVAAHVGACFAKEADVYGQIIASPATITTTAQIDAAFAALSTTY